MLSQKEETFVSDPEPYPDDPCPLEAYDDNCLHFQFTYYFKGMLIEMQASIFVVPGKTFKTATVAQFLLEPWQYRKSGA